MKRWLTIVIVVVGAVLFAGAGFGVGYVVANDDDSNSHGFNQDQMAMMMYDGSMMEMMQQHIDMMNQLRESMTPEMRQQMDNDPMWQLMESGEFMQMMNDCTRLMRNMPGMQDDDQQRKGGN